MINSRSLYDKKVNITDDVITVMSDESAGELTCRARLLFAETFYNDDMKKYKLLSISNPLVPGTESHCREEGDANLLTQADCVEFLRKNVPGGKTILRKTEETAAEFNFIHSSGNLSHPAYPQVHSCDKNEMKSSSTVPYFFLI